jgi:hypothetical protein
MNAVHPFNPDYSKLGQDELDTKYAEIMKRLHIVRRMNMAQNMEDQLWMLLDGIDAEKQRRMNQDQDQGGVVLETDPLPVKSAKSDPKR